MSYVKAAAEERLRRVQSNIKTLERDVKYWSEELVKLHNTLGELQAEEQELSDWIDAATPVSVQMQSK